MIYVKNLYVWENLDSHQWANITVLIIRYFHNIYSVYIVLIYLQLGIATELTKRYNNNKLLAYDSSS